MAHHGWGHSRYGGWGGGFGFGGLIPGLLLGELLSDGRGRSEAQPWPPAPQTPRLSRRPIYNAGIAARS